MNITSMIKEDLLNVLIDSKISPVLSAKRTNTETTLIVRPLRAYMLEFKNTYNKS